MQASSCLPHLFVCTTHTRSSSLDRALHYYCPSLCTAHIMRKSTSMRLLYRMYKKQSLRLHPYVKVRPVAHVQRGKVVGSHGTRPRSVDYRSLGGSRLAREQAAPRRSSACFPPSNSRQRSCFRPLLSTEQISFIIPAVVC